MEKKYNIWLVNSQISSKTGHEYVFLLSLFYLEKKIKKDHTALNKILHNKMEKYVGVMFDTLTCKLNVHKKNQKKHDELVCWCERKS